MKRVCLAIFPLVFYTAAFGHPNPANRGDEALGKARTAEWEKITAGKHAARKKLLGDQAPKALGVTIDKSTLEDAKKNLGAAAVTQTGDASTSERTLCYTGTDGTLVVFYSDEMHGGTTIGQFEIFANEKNAAVAHCASSPLVGKTLQSSKGLKLGLARKQILKLLGNPAKKELDFDYYRYEVPSGKDCTEWEDVYLHYEDGKVDRYSLRKGSYC